jgi:hypothetical protein
MVDLSMVSYNLKEAAKNLAGACRWLNATIVTAREIGADDLAGELLALKAYIGALHPSDVPLEMLSAVMKKHGGILETASRKLRARKIVAALTNIDIDDSNRSQTEENVYGILSELDKGKVY